MATDGQCADDYQFKSPLNLMSQGIYNKNTETRDKPGYYWILSRDYCGMTYTGSSCEDIYNKYPETFGKSGYYRIIDSGQTYCDMTSINPTLEPGTTSILSILHPTLHLVLTISPHVLVWEKNCQHQHQCRR